MPCLLRILFYIGMRSSLYANSTRSTNQYEIPTFVGLEQTWHEILGQSGLINEKSKQCDSLMKNQSSVRIWYRVLGAQKLLVKLEKWPLMRLSFNFQVTPLEVQFQNSATCCCHLEVKILQQMASSTTMPLFWGASWWWSLAFQQPLRTIAIEVGGGIFLCPLCFQISCESIGPMQTLSKTPRKGSLRNVISKLPAPEHRTDCEWSLFTNKTVFNTSTELG